jgi:hypothetical protein
MGAGESRYVQDQERFVRENIKSFKAASPSNYCESQLKGKLRQLYANTDLNNDNKYSYILEHDWKKIKSKVVPKYASLNEKQGYRNYN